MSAASLPGGRLGIRCAGVSSCGRPASSGSGSRTLPLGSSGPAELPVRSTDGTQAEIGETRRNAGHARSCGWRGEAAEAQVLPVLQGQGRRGGLQERRPAPAVHLGEGQDPCASNDRGMSQASAAGRRCDQARAGDGTAPVRDRRRPASAVTLRRAFLIAAHSASQTTRSRPWAHREGCEWRDQRLR